MPLRLVHKSGSVGRNGGQPHVLFRKESVRDVHRDKEVSSGTESSHTDEPASIFQDLSDDTESPSPETGGKFDRENQISLEMALRRIESLERENSKLRRRLRQAEKRVEESKVSLKEDVIADKTLEAVEKTKELDGTADEVQQAKSNRDDALVELRKKLEVVSAQFGKVEESEGNAGEETWDADTVDTSYDTAEDEEAVVGTDDVQAQ